MHTKQLNLQEALALDGFLEQLYESKHLPEREVLQLCEMARAVVSEEANVHSVRCPVTVVGARRPPGEGGCWWGRANFKCGADLRGRGHPRPIPRHA